MIAMDERFETGLGRALVAEGDLGKLDADTPRGRSPRWRPPTPEASWDEPSAAFEGAFGGRKRRLARLAVRRVEFQGSPDCVLLRDDRQEVVVCIQGAPRILSHRLVEGLNQVDPGEPRAGADRVHEGGHVARIMPEPALFGFGLFQQGCQWVRTETGARFLIHGESQARFSYEMEISLRPGGPSVRIDHRLTNHSRSPFVHALRLDCPHPSGGVLIAPRTEQRTGSMEDSPTSTLDLWAGTDLRSPCWSVGRRYLRVRHMAMDAAQRLALRVPQGWLAHQRGNSLFLRRFDGSHRGLYPESASNVELVASPRGLESRILCSPRLLDRDKALVVSEEWRIVPAPLEPLNEDRIDELCLPVVGEGIPMR